MISNNGSSTNINGKLGNYAGYIRALNDRKIVCYEMINYQTTTSRQNFVGNFFFDKAYFDNVEEVRRTETNVYFYVIKAKRNMNLKIYAHAFGVSGNAYIMYFTNGECKVSESFSSVDYNNPLIFDITLNKGDTIGISSSIVANQREMYITLND